MADTNTVSTNDIEVFHLWPFDVPQVNRLSWIHAIHIAVRTVRLFAVYFIYKTKSSFVCLITFKLAYLWASSIYLNSIKKRESKKQKTQRETQRERESTKSSPFHAMPHGYNSYVAVELSVYFFCPCLMRKRN